MPIDAYSPCPGGTGKKIKFCCPDFLSQLEKIERMLDGDQHVACLNYVEQLEQQRADRACLLAIKCLLLRVGGQHEAARAAVAQFLSHHPENPVALAESAMLTAASEGGRAAMELLQRAIAASGDVTARVYEAIGIVAEVLLSEGHVPAARALLVLQVALDRKDQRALGTLMEVNRWPAVPLLVRDDRPLEPCAKDAPWKVPLDEAMASVDHGRWAEAAAKLEALAQQTPDAPVVWRDLAILRGWLADTPGCVEAWRKVASLGVPAEDAVEAEALALCLVEDPLGDQRDVCTLSYEVDDVEQLQAGLTLAPQVVPARIDPRRVAEEGQPPPKAVYLLLDRPAPKSPEEVTVQSIPCVLALARLFGRQTDREARLAVMRTIEDDVPRIREVLDGLVGHGLRPDPQQDVEGRLSASMSLLTSRAWVPQEAASDRIAELFEQQRLETVLHAWPNVPMGLLEGKSPRQAAAEPEAAAKLSAAVMLLEIWSARTGGRLDLNPLRSELGVPVLGPIDPQQTPVETLPLVRLARVETDKLTDEALRASFYRAAVFGAREAGAHFARELVHRPSMAGRKERLAAYRLLAHVESDADRALEYVGQGRQAAEAAGQSSASWDLQELTLHFDRGDGDEAGRLLQHIEREHISEPGVGEELTRTLMEYGLINPDGTPAAPPEAQPLDDESGAEPPGAEPGKLWTPESQKPAEKKTLWTPGMD